MPRSEIAEPGQYILQSMDLYNEAMRALTVTTTGRSAAESGEAFQKWQVSTLNCEYEFCPTYPRVLLTPQDLTDEMLTNAAGQRSKKRLPVLSYLSTVSGAPLCRSAQPSGRGTLNHDERLLEALHYMSPPAYGKVMQVVDARSNLAAQANAVFKGKGFENLARLGSEFHLKFLDIGNIHTMRGSLDSLGATLAADDDLSYLGGLEGSQWLAHSRSLLAGAVFVSNSLEVGNSTLVHCSDGWDRTSQLCALGQILHDPYFRTRKGYQVLVDKDFGYFGHGLDMRGTALGGSGSERSPILFQFLDATYQLMSQFPRAFEFNEAFLRLIMAGYSSRCFCNFWGDCASDRECAMGAMEKKLMQKPPTLWEYIDAFVGESAVKNSLFKSELEDEALFSALPCILRPCLDLRAFHLWEAHFTHYLPHLTVLHSEAHRTREDLLLERIRVLEEQIKVGGSDIRVANPNPTAAGVVTPPRIVPP